MSGGRDVWTGPLASTPADPLAATWTALNEVLDPEIPISVVELGLIYGVELEEGVVTVRLTFTATACPCMGFIREDISDRLEQEPWVERVEIVEVYHRRRASQAQAARRRRLTGRRPIRIDDRDYIRRIRA